MDSKFVETNNIKLHYIEYPAKGPILILMHGLTSNAFCFEGILFQGLIGTVHIISVDLRGRGLSDHPPFGYSMQDHALDIIGLMDALGIEKANVGGHSFGAWISYYLAANYSQRVERLVLIDAAAQMHPNVFEMLQPAMNRLGKTFESFDEYVTQSKKASFLTFFDDALMPYYQADVAQNEDGTVTQRSKQEHMQEAITKVLQEPWLTIIKGIAHPAILFNGTEPYVLGAPLLPQKQALETVRLMEQCTYQEVPGNHLTMLYGQGAKQIAKATQDFLLK